MEKVVNKDGSWNGDRMVEFCHDLGDTRDFDDNKEWSLLVDKNGYEFLEERNFDYFLAQENYYKRQ